MFCSHISDKIVILHVGFFIFSISETEKYYYYYYYWF
jgi:hypothetical protein